MSRPKLTERVTIRLPEELLQDLTADAARRVCSLNEVILSAVELDLSRRLTYRLDYYTQLRPALGGASTVTLSDNPSACRTTSARALVGA